jgi:hypothetical protein
VEFADVKTTAHKCLNGCPVDVIRHLFNCSWQFMKAYYERLTRKTAEWAMQKQKSHWQAEEKVMASIEGDQGSQATADV